MADEGSDGKRNSRAVDELVELLRSQLLSGQFTPGAGMPSEKELTRTLQVQRPTLRAAYARLEVEGLLVHKPGKGMWVRDHRETGTLPLLPYLDIDGHLHDIVELRRVVMAESAGRAAGRATFEDLADLAEHARKQSGPGDTEAFRAGDRAFMSRLVRTSGSLPLRMVFQSLDAWLQAHPGLHDRLLANRATVLAGYTAIVNLVRSGDERMARSAVRQALDKTDAEALLAP